MDGGLDDSVSTGVLLGRLRRRLGLLIAVALGFVVVTMALTAIQPKIYQASTKIALEPAGNRNDLERILFGSTELRTQQEILVSRPLVTALLEAQGLPVTPGAVDEFIERDLKVRALLETTVLEVAVRSPSPERAAALAQGLSEAYLSYLKQDADARVQEALKDLESQAVVARQQLRSIEAQLAGGAGELEDSLQEERDALYAQLRFISARSAELQTTNALARRGDILEPAVAPRAPVSPKPLLNVAIALVLGLLFGTAVALLRDLRDDRIRGASDVDATSPPLLGLLGAGYGRLKQAGSEDADDAYRRVRTTFRSVIPSSPSGATPVALVALGDSRTALNVALKLGATAARGGHRAVVIDTVGEASQLPDLPVQVLGELLAADGALDSSPAEGLRVIRAAGWAGGGDRPEAFDGPCFPTLLARLREDADELYVVVRSTTHGDALAACAHTGRAVVVAELGSTTRRQLDAEVTDLQRIGVPVLGVVLATDDQGRSNRPTAVPVPAPTGPADGGR
jgi:capsular polysaccharide biosynthesis protein